MKVIRVAASLLIVWVICFSAVYIVGAEDEECIHRWDFRYSLEFEPGYWTPGPHNYEMEIVGGPYDGTFWINEFEATESADPIKGQVQLRLSGLTSIDEGITEIHPSQDTVMQLSWHGDEGEYQIDARPTKYHCIF